MSGSSHPVCGGHGVGCETATATQAWRHCDIRAVDRNEMDGRIRPRRADEYTWAGGTSRVEHRLRSRHSAAHNLRHDGAHESGDNLSYWSLAEFDRAGHISSGAGT